MVLSAGGAPPRFSWRGNRMESLAGMGQGGGVVRLSRGREAVGWASEKRQRMGGVSPWTGVARRPGVGCGGSRKGEAADSKLEAMVSSFSRSWKPKVSTMETRKQLEISSAHTYP